MRREERSRIHDDHSVPAAEHLEWLELLKGGEGERGVGEEVFGWGPPGVGNGIEEVAGVDLFVTEGISGITPKEGIYLPFVLPRRRKSTLALVCTNPTRQSSRHRSTDAYTAARAYARL